MDRRRKALTVELIAAVLIAAVGLSSAAASPAPAGHTTTAGAPPSPTPSASTSPSAMPTSVPPSSATPSSTAPHSSPVPTSAAPTSAGPTSPAPTGSPLPTQPLPDGLPAATSAWTAKPFPKPVAGSPMSAGALQASLTAGGATITAYSTTSTLQAVRITLPAPDSPPAWPGSPAVVTGSSPSSGWIVWPQGIPATGLVVYAHGCCAVPTDLGQEAAGVASASHALVVAMDFRQATSYAPDIASEDSAAATTLLKATFGTLLHTTVGYGVSEGGSILALMIEHHPGLVDRLVDEAGPVDLMTSAHQLYADLAPLAVDTDSVATQNLLNLIAAAVAPGINQTKLAALSPVEHESLLSGLKEVVIVHATGDEVVPYSESAAFAASLDALHVPVTLTTLIPASGQPTESTYWHVTTQALNDSVAVVTRMLESTPIVAGLHETVEEAVIS